MSVIYFDLSIKQCSLSDELVIWETIPKPKCFQSLSCDFSRIKNINWIYQSNGKVRDHTTGIVYASLVIGLNSINHFNKSEWAYRLGVLERHQMPIGRYVTPNGPKNWWPSSDDIDKHLGLRVIEAPCINRRIWYPLLFAKQDSKAG